jgi:hypothetical protein
MGQQGVTGGCLGGSTPCAASSAARFCTCSCVSATLICDPFLTPESTKGSLSSFSRPRNKSFISFGGSPVER